MSDIVIKAENLGKQYTIGHQAENGRYLALRDVLMQNARSLWHKTKDLVRGKPILQGDTLEDVWALKDVSFEVRRGEVVGIIGRNGAGKSTLLKVLSRVTEPSSGRVTIKGRIASLLEVGTGFHPELTGRENIYLNGAILGMVRDEIKKKFDDIVAFSEVEKYLDTPVKRYSSGMYVRLAFAVAAHLEPEILLVDEVLAVGDVAFQKKCLGKMGNVSREGRTVLFVTHNMAAMRSLCSRAFLLSEGELVASGHTEKMVTDYLLEGDSDVEAIVTLPDNQKNEMGRGLCLRFLAPDDRRRAQFRLGERWHIIVEFEMFRFVPHVIAAVGITTVDGLPLTTYWSKAQDLPTGKYRVEFEVDLPLKACELRFIVGLSSYERAFYYLERVGRVSISEAALNEQPIRACGAGILVTSQTAVIQPLG